MGHIHQAHADRLRGVEVATHGPCKSCELAFGAVRAGRNAGTPAKNGARDYLGLQSNQSAEKLFQKWK